jgi:putative DNA primase/helicase
MSKKAPPTPTPDDMLEAALRYAAAGFRVHPLRAGTKIPRLNDWPEQATTKAKTIKHWWAKWPTSNIGIATGRASNLWVLDVDAGTHPDEVAEALSGMIADNGALPDTRTIRTPSGGLHYWFRFPEGKGHWTNSTARITERYGTAGQSGRKVSGLDVRGEGGQVAVAPSVVNADNKGVLYPGGGRHYALARAVELAPVPKWLRKLTRVKDATASALPVTDYDVEALTEHDQARVASYLVTVTEAIAAELDSLTADPQAQWDNEVFVRAQRLVDLANAPWSPLTLDEVRGLLLAHAPRDKGFPDKRVLAKLDSAVKRATAVLPLPIMPTPHLTTFDFPEHLKADPDRFFSQRKGLLAAELADEVSDDLGVGLDGSTWVYGLGVWTRNDDEIERRVVRALGNRYRREHAGIARSVIMKGGDLPRIEQQPTPRLINLSNGMLDWAAGTLEPHDAAYLSTVQLPHAYNPAAVCPAFDRWLAEVLPADVIPLVWELLGYLVMSGNPRQIAIALFGDGLNGKGTLLRVINALLGRHNTSNVTLRDLAEGRFEVATLFGKIANVAGDIDAKYLNDTSKFKAITGGDVVQAQHKYGHPFSFTPWAVPIFSANEKWKSADTTTGYFRRWLTIPFPRKVAELSGNFEESALFAELPGILNGAIAGLLRLEVRGRFVSSESVDRLMREFKEESDVVAIWLANDERVLSEAGNTALTALRPDTYRRFQSWALDNGHTGMSSDRFYQRLERLGFEKVRRANGVTYLGLGIALPSALAPQTSG